jgi:hypothetical protein
MSQHTPGPWEISGAWVQTLNKNPIASFNFFAATEANQRLIAAVPDLLAALGSAVWMLNRDFIDPQKLKVIEKCEAAIAKATGEA